MNRLSLYRRAGLVAAAMAVTGCAGKPAMPPWPAEISAIHTSSPVTWFAMAKTQALAAIVGQDHKLRILSVLEGTERRAIDLADRAVDAMAISSDGKLVAIGDHKGGISVWSTDTGASRLELQLARYPGFAVFSHNGATLAIAAQGDPVQLIDVATGRPSAVLGHPVGGTLAFAFSPDDRFVATGDGDAVVRVYDAHTGERVSENRELLMVPLTVAFTAQGTSVISGSGDKALLFIDALSGKTTKRMDRTRQPVTLVDVSPDGTSFTTVFMKSEDMTQPDHVIIRDMSSGEPQVDWLPPTLPVGGGWTADGRMLVAISSSDTLHLWRLR